MTRDAAAVTGGPRPRADRLSRQADFDVIYRQGRRVRGRLLTLVALPQPDNPRPRAAYVVSKKVAKQAVRRNRVRRRLREALRCLMREPGLAGCPDLIIIAAPAAEPATYWDLLTELTGLLRRGGWLVAESDTVGERDAHPTRHPAGPALESGK